MYIHNSAIIDSGAEIGQDTKIWHFSHVMGSAKIGKNCSIGQNCFIGENVVIGDNVKIQNNVSIFEGVTIEKGVFIGPSVVFTNVIRPRSLFPTNKKYLKTIVEQGATIGANATIICGNVIENHSMIGAGAVVNKTVLAYSLVVGNPLKIIGWVDEYGDNLKFENNIAIDSRNLKKYEAIYKDEVIVRVNEL